MGRTSLMTFGAGFMTALAVWALASTLGTAPAARPSLRRPAGRGGNLVLEAETGLRPGAGVESLDDEPPEGGEAPRARMSNDAIDALRAPGGLSFSDKPGAAAGYAALASLFALAGRPAEYVEAAALALAAGEDPDSLLAGLHWLPAAARADTLEALYRDHPDAEWDYRALAGILAEAGRPERAADLLLEGIFGSEGESSELIDALIELDAPRAASALLGSASRPKWSGSTLEHIAGRLESADQAAAALSFARLALEAAPGNTDALRLMGRLDPAGALQHAEGRVRAKSDDVDAWRILGELRLESGDRSGAFEAFREAAKRSPSKANFRKLLRTDPARAVPVLEELAKNIRDDEAIGVLAHGLEDVGRRDEAFAVFERAHDLDRTDSEWLRGMARLDPGRTVELLEGTVGESGAGISDEIVGAYANALRKVGRTSDAYRWYEVALEKDDDDREWMEGLAEADPARAAEELGQRLRGSGSDAKLRGALGLALSRLGRTREAVEQLEGALDASHSNHLYLTLARVSPAAGLARVRAAVARDADNDELWGTLGKVYEELGRGAEARAAFEKALELDPDDGEWIRKLARLRN